MALKVFIGWSGRRSFQVAKKLTTWLPQVIPGVEPWMSDMIRGGAVEWFEKELNRALRQSDFAVMCVAPENWHNPWFTYEAGVVLGQTETERRIFPYIIEPHALRRFLPEPLKFFWAEKADYEGTLKLVAAINDAAQGPLKGPELKAIFDEKWRELHEVLKEVYSPPPPPRPGPKDYIEDFTKVSRCIDLHQERLFRSFHDLIGRTVNALKAGTYDREAITRAAVAEVRRSKDRFASDHSLLVGNVADFFGDNYEEESLLAVVAEMAAALRPYEEAGRPPTGEELSAIRENWIAHMRQSVMVVFWEFQEKLVDRLKQSAAPPADDAEKAGGAERARRHAAVSGADSLRERLETKYGQMPDSAEELREDRER